MAVSQGHILNTLEKACSNLDEQEFIYLFLEAFDFPKATITRIRNNDRTRNVGMGSDIGLKNRLYFHRVKDGESVAAAAEKLRNSEVVARNDIRFVITTDFQTLFAFDRTAQESLEIDFNELPKEYGFFLPLAGYEKAFMFSDHPADSKAAGQMGRLFDIIKQLNSIESDADIHALNVFFARLLFCFYAEDTGIFEKNQTTQSIASYTRADGSDLTEFFDNLFLVLNLGKDSPERAKLPAHFQRFEYVNGGLFNEYLCAPQFNRAARRILLDCGRLDWSEINPDIFGSMFQAVIGQEQRSAYGQHYTSVPNIMKVIQPLFLDTLNEEYKKSVGDEKKLKALLIRLQNIRVFDPACGSGNFLIIAYKELRKLEMKVIDALNELNNQNEIYYSGIELSQFYGIEIDDFAREIAVLALWLAEHQMNAVFEEKFGHAKAALPLKDGGNIVLANSLLVDWEDICPTINDQGKLTEVYVCGNPPFLGTRDRTAEQRHEMDMVFAGFRSRGQLDYVAAWFWKGAQYIKSKKAKAAFVATNSIVQGSQVATLWPPIFGLDISIDFAFKTFSWKNHARDNAAVHVVIVGLKNDADRSIEPRLFEVVNGENKVAQVKNISPYLTAGSNLAVVQRSRPLGDVSRMLFGNKPTDGGHLYLTDKGRSDFLSKYPDKAHWVKRIVGSREFLHNINRWCFWLADVSLEEAMAIPEVKDRCYKVKDMRLSSRDKGAQRLAERPHQFRDLNNPEQFVLVPRVSSERRPYIPIGYFSSDVISSDANQIIPNATLYEFGILTSEMHNDWMRAVAGRLKSDYRYSGTMVYNTFPWPEASKAKRKHIEELAEEVLMVREDFPHMTLAELYNPETMPKQLLQAHQELDRAVEALYRERPFRNAAERLEHLFNRYEKLIEAEKAKK